MYIKFVIIYLHVKIIIFTSKGIVMLKALVIENDQRLNSQYCSFLAKQGYDTVSAHDALEALSIIDSNSVNIVICDYDLPNIDGFMVIERIRANDEEVPILATSTQNDLKSKQRAFNAGCDDYLVKPVDLNELALRLSALLRRTRSTSHRPSAQGVLAAFQTVRFTGPHLHAPGHHGRYLGNSHRNRRAYRRRAYQTASEAFRGKHKHPD